VALLFFNQSTVKKKSKRQKRADKKAEEKRLFTVSQESTVSRIRTDPLTGRTSFA